MTQVYPFPEAALDDLPVFPLPDATLFPGSMMPLHVFEGRYRQMVRRAIATHRCIAVARLLEPARQLADDVPFESCAGLGVIVQAVELPDGRFHLLLQGKARVRLTELPFSPPFRRAKAVVTPTVDDVASSELQAIDVLIEGYLGALRRLNPNLEIELPPREDDHEAYLDALATVLPMEANERQRVLAAESLAERASLLLTTLATEHAEVTAVMTGNLSNLRTSFASLPAAAGATKPTPRELSSAPASHPRTTHGGSPRGRESGRDRSAA
jgi:Lon protease-like protein